MTRKPKKKPAKKAGYRTVTFRGHVSRGGAGLVALGKYCTFVPLGCWRRMPGDIPATLTIRVPTKEKR